MNASDTENEENKTFTPDNYAQRNKALINLGVPPAKVVKTGTTIVGTTFKDGVVIGCDSRATSGNTIADKFCMKLQRITDKIYCCGAGTAADLHQVSRKLESDLTLLELKMRCGAKVVEAVGIAKKHLFRYQGYIGAYLIIGGVDIDGAHLFNVHAGGSSQRHAFVADGSGSLAAMAILEREFKLNMSEEEATSLVKKSLEAGMHADLSSGNTYRVAIIKKSGMTLLDNLVPGFCAESVKELKYDQKIDAKLILKTDTKKYAVVDETSSKAPSIKDVEMMELDEKSTKSSLAAVF